MRCYGPLPHRDKHNCSCRCALEDGHKGKCECELTVEVGNEVG